MLHLGCPFHSPTKAHVMHAFVGAVGVSLTTGFLDIQHVPGVFLSRNRMALALRYDRHVVIMTQN